MTCTQACFSIFDSTMHNGEKNAMDRSEPYDELQKLVIQMNSHRAVIENVDCASTTLVKVDGEMNDLILFKTVQMLSNLSLSIKKAYISTDEQWSMNVFYVTDRNGEKLVDKEKISYIEQFFVVADNEPAAVSPNLNSLATFELIGPDRPGLLSDIFVVLSDICCRVVEAKFWTHAGRIAAIISVEEKFGKQIKHPMKIECIRTYLSSIVNAGYAGVFSSSVTADHRLHQMMHSSRDYELADSPSVSIENWTDRGYSMVTVQCQDRPKLLFDVTCTLTDMNYVVFHGNIDTTDDRAYQEFYIRHSDSEGSPINSDEEKKRVIQCLQAAIDRRSSEDLRLELRAPIDHHWFLPEATRTLREKGLSVTMAEVSTKGRNTMSVFYLAGTAGNQVDEETIASIIETVDTDSLKISHGQLNQSRNMRPNTASDGTLVSPRILFLRRFLKQSIFHIGTLLLVAGTANNQGDKEAIDCIIKRFGMDSLKNSHGRPNRSSGKLQTNTAGDETSVSARLLSLGSWVKQGLFKLGSLLPGN